MQDVVKGEEAIFEVERIVLEEVLKRPPLYDWSMSHKERQPDLLFKLLMEVSEVVTQVFDINLPSTCIENTFNHHRALYVQYSNGMKLPSGSGSNRVPKKPKHLEVMTQLDYLYVRRDQISTTTDAGFDLIPPKGRGGKNKNNDDGVDHLMKSANNLINVMQKQSTEPLPPPITDSAPDHHFAFFLTLLPDFRRLHKIDKREFKIKVMGLLNDYLTEYDDEDDTSSKLKSVLQITIGLHTEAVVHSTP